jgi:hypothetical protein
MLQWGGHTQLLAVRNIKATTLLPLLLLLGHTPQQATTWGMLTLGMGLRATEHLDRIQQPEQQLLLRVPLSVTVSRFTPTGLHPAPDITTSSSSKCSGMVRQWPHTTACRCRIALNFRDLLGSTRSRLMPLRCDLGVPEGAAS